MYIDFSKLTEEVRWEISHDKTADHVFTVKSKIGNWTQSLLGLTLKEAISLTEQLNFAIQDFQIGGNNGKV